MAARGLVFADMRGFFELTLKGREAIGESAPPKPWVKVEAISAAASREVLARRRVEVDDEPQAIERKLGRPSKYEGYMIERERLRA